MSQKSSIDPQSIPDSALPTMLSFAQTVALLGSYNEQLLELQKESSRILTAEFSLRQIEFLNAVRAVAETSPRAERQQAYWMKMMETAGGWFKLATQFQAAMLQVLSESISSPGQGIPAVAGQGAGASSADRRGRSVVINFPERRAA